MKQEGGETWSNAPGATYAPHSHPYHKSLRCLEGSITFTLHDGPAARDVLLRAGDSLEIPLGTVHSAVAGPEGVTCSERHSPAGSH